MASKPPYAEKFPRQWAWEQRNPDKVRNRQLRYKHGITLEQYNTMLEEQRGKCKICGALGGRINPRTQRPSNLSVDHDHKTNQIRGLLCDDCNTGLGKFKDQPKLLERAIHYLRGDHG